MPLITTILHGMYLGQVPFYVAAIFPFVHFLDQLDQFQPVHDWIRIPVRHRQSSSTCSSVCREYAMFWDLRVFCAKWAFYSIRFTCLIDSGHFQIQSMHRNCTKNILRKEEIEKIRNAISWFFLPVIKCATNGPLIKTCRNVLFMRMKAVLQVCCS